jgi:hypothetical protein
MTMVSATKQAAARASAVLATGLVAAFAVIGVMVLWPSAGLIHGYLMPQVTKFAVTDMREQDDGSVVVWGYLVKPWWATCEPLRTQWYVGVRDKWNRPRAVEWLDEDIKGRTTRPKGTSAWGPWRIRLRPGEAALPQFSDVVHECGPWETITRQCDGPAGAAVPDWCRKGPVLHPE